MRRSPFYRIITIIFCYVIVGVFVFLPFSAEKNRNWIVFWIVVGVYAAALIATIVIEEIQTAKRIKALEEKEKAEAENASSEESTHE